MTDAVSVTADKPTNALIINASPEDFGTLRAIVRQLDVKRKQVFVEALILELSMDATRDLGASIAGFIPTGDEGVIYGGMNQTAPAMGVLAPASGSTGALANTPSLLTQSITGIMAGGLFNLIDIKGPNGEILTVPAISALINLSKTDGDINILSAPRLLTSDNEEAEIVVGSNVPIISSRLTNAVGGSDSLAQSVTVERKDVALTLRFTPQVTEGNLVRLKIFQEMTDLAATNIGNVNDVGPTLTKRLLKNTVLAENGKTVVLGGLIGTNNKISETKVPFLGDIPIIGWLFKTQSSSSKKTNLLIFITPRIIRNAEDLAEVTRRSHDAMQRFRVEEMGQDVLGDRERLEPYLNIGTPSESVPEATTVSPSVLAPAPEVSPAESNIP
jgi:general secretion pathway protein D